MFCFRFVGMITFVIVVKLKRFIAYIFAFVFRCFKFIALQFSQHPSQAAFFSETLLLELFSNLQNRKEKKINYYFKLDKEDFAIGVEQIRIF